MKFWREKANTFLTRRHGELAGRCLPLCLVDCEVEKDLMKVVRCLKLTPEL